MREVEHFSNTMAPKKTRSATKKMKEVETGKTSLVHMLDNIHKENAIKTYKFNPIKLSR